MQKALSTFSPVAYDFLESGRYIFSEAKIFYRGKLCSMATSICIAARLSGEAGGNRW
ncbi:MAG: hypothetical protein HYT83_02950 [Candidatus Levybacteria bacterium]|nr:hypothetical protein [Candidatus Levybacteria bacterium]